LESRISKFLYRRAHALPLTLLRRNERAVSRNILGGHTSQKYPTIEIIQEINEVKHVQPVLTNAVEADSYLILFEG
jgi:hypothetical protein